MKRTPVLSTMLSEISDGMTAHPGSLAFDISGQADAINMDAQSQTDQPAALHIPVSRMNESEL